MASQLLVSSFFSHSTKQTDCCLPELTEQEWTLPCNSRKMSHRRREMRRQAPASRCWPKHLGCNRNQRESLQKRVGLGSKEARLPRQCSKGIEASRGQKGPETRDPGAFSLLHVSASLCIIPPHTLAFSVMSIQHDRGGHLRDQPGSN